VNLIHNQRADRGQQLAARLRSEQQVKRFRRGDENVRRSPRNRLPLCRRRVPGAHLRPHFNVAAFLRPQRGANSRQRFLEVLVNVVAQRLQRRHIEDPCLVRQRSRQSFTKQRVQRGQKSRQRFARTRRRGDQRVAARLDRRPAAFLRFGGRSELLLE